MERSKLIPREMMLEQLRDLYSIMQPGTQDAIVLAWALGELTLSGDDDDGTQ